MSDLPEAGTTAALAPGGPLALRAERVLLRPPGAPRQHQAASLARLDGGRLLLAFRAGSAPERRNDGAILLAASDDGGETWEDPRPLFAYPGWDCFPMGGLLRFGGDRLWLVLGRIRFDSALGGDEPMDGWYTAATESRDGGRTWSEPGPEIRLFPGWTELYGASNPHRLSDGRYLCAAIGTRGRDAGWHAGVVFLDPPGDGPPGTGFSALVPVAQAPDRNFADADVVRLADGRLLAVVREMVTRQAFCAHSADEGRTWSPPVPAGFPGANIKLHRLRSGAVLCAYRDEHPARRGVSCSLSEDGGATWRFLGQLYRAPAGVPHRPGYLCGYPDLVATPDGDLLCVLHTYPDARGGCDLRSLRLHDAT
jgi:hypothetical protein